MEKITFNPDIEREIEFKVRAVDAMYNQFLDREDLFFDVLGFVEYMKWLYSEREKSKKEYSAYQGDNPDNLWMLERRVHRMGNRILGGFGYFDMALRQRQIGSYSEIFETSRIEAGFPGSFMTILKAIDYVCGKTLADMGDEWYGFAVLTTVKDTASIASSIVAVKYNYTQKMDFIQDWLILGHEIGHIFFWDRDIEGLLIRYRDRETFKGTTLITELFADCFCYEHAYLGDIDTCLTDLIDLFGPRPIHLPPNKLRYQVYRLLGIWLFYLIKTNRNFAETVDAYLRSRPRRYRSRKKYLKEVLNEAVDRTDIVPLSKEVLRSEIVERIFQDFKKYDDRQRRADDLRMLIDQISELAASPVVEKTDIGLPKRVEYDLGVTDEQAEKVINGGVVYDTIEHPFGFLKSLRDRCNNRKIELDQSKNTHIRVAAILSLANSYLRLRKGKSDGVAVD